MNPGATHITSRRECDRPCAPGGSLLGLRGLLVTHS